MPQKKRKGLRRRGGKELTSGHKTSPKNTEKEIPGGREWPPVVKKTERKFYVVEERSGAVPVRKGKKKVSRRCQTKPAKRLPRGGTGGAPKRHKEPSSERTQKKKHREEGPRSRQRDKGN